MCVWLKPDFIVGLVIKDNCDMSGGLPAAGMTVGIDDCLEKQINCERSGFGNVVANSHFNDFVDYFNSNRRYFKRLSNNIYSVRLENLRKDDNYNELDYLRLLNRGKYLSGTLEDFGIPI